MKHDNYVTLKICDAAVLHAVGSWPIRVIRRVTLGLSLLALAFRVCERLSTRT